MIGVVRYWKPIVLALVIAVVCTAWRTWPLVAIRRKSAWPHKLARNRRSRI